MARLTTYQTDTNVTGADKVIGTDTDGATKNYTLDSVGEYFTQNNVVTVAGQLSFVFEASASDAGNGQFFVNDGTGGIPELADITKLNVSTKYADGPLLEQMLNEIIADKFIIVEARNQNVKAVLTTQSYGVNASDNTYKDITVTVSEASGGLEDGKVYLLSKYSATGDKHHTHIQSGASSTWTVAHNLNKKPSVAIVDSSDNVIQGQVDHTSLNNLTITLSAPTSGKAYIN
jgi:hypothetical protein